MKKFMKFSIVTAILLAITVSFSSCYKKQDTIAVVTVLDKNEKPVSGAEVKLDWINTTEPKEHREDLLQKATSDGSGKASFNYNELYKSGQAGVFVLDVYVNGAIVGIIKVEQETTSEATVILQ